MISGVGGDFPDRMTALGYLADGFVLAFGRVSLLAHGTPPVRSILASGVADYVIAARDVLRIHRTYFGNSRRPA